MKIEHLASSSEGNAHLINGEILLDCGISINRIRENVHISDLKGILATHEHQDHVKAAEDLLRAGVTVYCSLGTATSLGIADHHNVSVVDAREQFQVGDWTVKAFEVVHDAEDPIGFLFQRDDFKGIYLTDSAYSKYKFEGLTHALIECNFAKDILDNKVENGAVHPARKNRVIQNHFSLRDVKNFLQEIDRSQLKEVHLLHLSEENSDEKRFKKEVQEIVGVPVEVAPRMNY